MKTKKFFSFRRVAAVGVLGLAGLAVTGVAIKNFIGANAVTAEIEGEESGVSLSDLVEINPLYEQYLEDVENGNGEEWSVIPNKYRAKSQAASYSTRRMLAGEAAATLPTKYSLIDDYATTIKNQGLNGDCWAYATTTVMESFLKKNEDIDYEFAPKQLDYLYANDSPYYEYLTTKSGFNTKELGGGGNFAAATLLMGGGTAPIKSTEFFELMQENDAKLLPFTSWDNYNSIAYLNAILSLYPGLVVFDDEGSVDANGVYNKAIPNDELFSETSDYVVTEYKGFSGRTNNTEKIKESVLNNGAVYASMWWPEDVDTSTACWDAENKTVIEKDTDTCEAVSNGMHALAIVGWDDDYEYNGGKGAFLLQNSWGKEGEYNYDELVAQGTLDVSSLDETARASLRNILTNWETDEFVWLAYDYDTTTSESLMFGIIEEMKDNNYENIYDMKDEKSVVASSTAIQYNFTTDGGQEEYIGEIGIATVLEPADDVIMVAYMKKDGVNYEEVGRVPLNKNEYGRGQIELVKQITVKGDFSIVLALTNVAGETLNGLSTYAYDFYPSIYMEEKEIEVPGTGGEEPGTGEDSGTGDGSDIEVPSTGVPEGVDEPTKSDGPTTSGSTTVSKAPETGWFTGNELGAKLAGVLMLVVALTGAGFGIYTYRERKHLFHKIDFEKK